VISPSHLLTWYLKALRQRERQVNQIPSPGARASRSEHASPCGVLRCVNNSGLQQEDATIARPSAGQGGSNRGRTRTIWPGYWPFAYGRKSLEARLGKFGWRDTGDRTHVAGKYGDQQFSPSRAAGARRSCGRIKEVVKCQRKFALAGANFARRVIRANLKCTTAISMCQMQCEIGVLGPLCSSDPPERYDPGEVGSNAAFRPSRGWRARSSR